MFWYNLQSTCNTKGQIMSIKDSQGRITQLEVGENLHSGHSVCANCGKDMPICWEAVCKSCLKTVCYNCCADVGGHWICKKDLASC
jgi:hypothetical protein